MDDKEYYSTFGVEKITSFIEKRTADRKCNLCEANHFDLMNDKGVLGVTKHSTHFFDAEPPVYEFWCYIMVCITCGHQHFMNAKFITSRINKLEKDDS